MGLGRDGVTAALVMAGLGAVVGNVVGGTLADRLGPFRTLLVLAAAQIAIMPILLLLPIPLVAAYCLILVWIGACYASNAAQQVRLVALAGPRAPVALSLHAASIYLGTAIGAALGGRVTEAAGIEAVGVAGGVCAVAAVAHILASRRATPVDTVPVRA